MYIYVNERVKDLWEFWGLNHDNVRLFSLEIKSEEITGLYFFNREDYLDRAFPPHSYKYLITGRGGNNREMWKTVDIFYRHGNGASQFHLSYKRNTILQCKYEPYKNKIEVFASHVFCQSKWIDCFDFMETIKLERGLD